MRRVKILLTIIVVVVVFYLINQQKVLADSFNNVYINEIMWSGSSLDSSDEFIELYNNSNNDIDISGWKIQNAARSNGTIELPENSIITSKSYFLISKLSNVDINSILNTESDYIESKLSLKDEQNGDLILTDSNSNIIDQAKGNYWPAGKNNVNCSAERINYSDGILEENWQNSYKRLNLKDNVVDFATPKASNALQLFSIPDNPNQFDQNYLNTDQIAYVDTIVNYVVDGDTIKAYVGSELTNIRLIGIDAPENASHSDFGIDEPYYEQSKQYLLDNLLGKNVKLIVSKNPNERYDNYNRLLAIIISNDEIININLLKMGFARSYYIENNLINSGKWIIEERYAQQNLLGIWKNYDNDCLLISEIMVNPEGLDKEGEWIELFNKCSQDINLQNYIIDDSEGGSYPYKINENVIIEANNYYCIDSLNSNIALNNSSDEVRLFNPSLNIIQDISYHESFEGKSYALFDGEYKWTSSPTKCSQNKYDNKKHDYKKISNLKDLKNTKEGQYVDIKGYVNSKPQTLSKQYIYIQDKTGGVQIYNYYGKFGNLSIGDYINVLGQRTGASILRVKIEETQDISILLKTKSIIPKKLNISKITVNDIGTAITVKGRATDLSGQIFYIEDNQKKLKISIKEYTGFRRPSMKSGDLIEITGILHQTYQGNLQLLPRSIEDILILESQDNQKMVIVNNLIEILALNEDDEIVVKGYVNSLPNTLDKRYFYIQDATYGVQIYSYHKLFPQLSIGDYIEVKGLVASSKQRVKTYALQNIKIIEKTNLIEPITSYEIDNLFGRLVFVEGKVVKKESGKITIRCISGEIIIFLKSNTNLKSSLFSKDDYVKIYGIVEEFKDGFRVCPRTANDIKIFKSDTKKNRVLSVNSNTNIIFPKALKYLEKSPEKSYNIITIKNSIISILIFLQMIILFISTKIMFGI